jgi:hypothetical protein
MTAMNTLGWSFNPGCGSRRGRPVAACVERLERRSLLTLQASPISAVAGQYVSEAIASFSAGDVQGTLADYQATIYWTGATTLITGGWIAPNGTGNYIVYGSNAYARPGSFPVNVVVTGANGSSAQATGTATVTDAPLNPSSATLSALIQTPTSGTVGSFSTFNPYATTADFTASIDWGDRSGPTAGTISSGGYSFFSVIGQHTYATVGTFPVTVTVRSPGGQTTVINSTAIATAQTVSVFPVQVTGNAGQPLGSPTVATFLDPYTTDTANDFRGVVNWGDGTASVGSITDQGGGVFGVVGDHTYLAPGNYTLNVQVIRIANGQTASNNSPAQIGSPSPNFAFTGGLAAVPANGGHIAGGRATTRFPTFDGTAAAFAIVRLFARPVKKDKQWSLGETVADANGSWSLATSLAKGKYLIMAQVTPPAGYSSLMMSLTQNGGMFTIGPIGGKTRALTRAIRAQVTHAGRPLRQPAALGEARRLSAHPGAPPEIPVSMGVIPPFTDT